MATTNATGYSGTIATANDTYIMRAIDGSSLECIATIALTDVGSCNASLVVSARPKGTSEAFREIPYEKLFLNGSSADGTLSTDSITGDSLIRVNASGLDIALVASGWSQGSMTYGIGLGRA